MAHLEFSKEITALLVIDPYNEFISAGGKIWDRIKKVAEANVGTPEVNRRTENCARSNCLTLGFTPVHEKPAN